jgi:hypothetical protein
MALKEEDSVQYVLQKMIFSLVEAEGPALPLEWHLSTKTT